MFDVLYSSFRNIISNIAIIGYSEKNIIKRGNNCNEKLELTCLFSYPSFDEKSYNEFTYDMMFPDGNHKIDCPKFFSLCLTDEKGNHSFLYCLKFPEKFKLDSNDNNKTIEINVPLIICIKSEKNDLESFRQLLTSINQIIVSENFDYDTNLVNNYKKVELMNIFYFIFSLPHTPPHSLVRLKLNNDLCEIEDEIDFYFSSNCEIPCNKNDTDINLLFLILDQTIIIKVIIAILSEKQIVFRASKAYLLHLIIPTFLKLIFPFKWIQTCITVLSKDKIDFLEMPGSFIMGVLSSTISIEGIMDEYPGIIIIDCDTNEIFGENNILPFIAPKDKSNEDNLAFKSKKSRDRDKEIFNNMEGGIKQGKNIFIVEGSFIYQYDPDIKGKGKRLKFDEKNNIIIDTQNSQFLIKSSNNFINSDEMKWLRKNIQLVRNPEIFDIENINNKKNNSFENISFDENESPILPNRSFSYNIQNILMHFYLKKISDINSEFMHSFKSTNLYLNFTDTKQFQNNSGKKVIENIRETIDKQRSIDNCFIVEYNNKPFCALSIIDRLDKKIIELKNELSNSNNNIINNEKDKNDKYHYYKYLKKVLMDYCLVMGINSAQAKNETFLNEDSKIQNASINSFSKSKLKHFKNIHKHVKSNKNVIQFTFNQNPIFNLTGIDKLSKNYFKFYGKDGFLYFLNDIKEFIKEEGKELENIIYKKKIYHQLINIYKNLDDIFKYQNQENNKINIDIDVLDNNIIEEDENDKSNINSNNNVAIERFSFNTHSISQSPPNEENTILNLDNQNNILEEIKSERKTNNSIAMSMIVEKDEEINESYIERSSQKKLTYKSINEDLGNILFKDENIDDDNPDIIIVFRDFENKNEKDDKLFINHMQFYNNNNFNKTKCLTQYYLFLAYYLEEINEDKILLEEFNKDIYNSLKVNVNINKFIIKFYKEAYIQSGNKHRDFPYFTFYSYLKNLDDEAFLKIDYYLKKEKNELQELYNIYLNILSKKKIKKDRINSNYEFGGNPLYNDRPNTINNMRNLNFGREESYSPNISFRPESYNNNFVPKNRISNKGILINNPSSSYSCSHLEDNKCNKIIVINNHPLFKPSCKPNSIHILNDFCSLLISCFPTKEEIKKKSIREILNETYIKVNTEPIRELLSELKIIKLSSLTDQRERLCFWLNCFNFLVLHAIFYLKLNIIKKEIWKNFFCNIKYNIGEYNFSFNDMLYIIFQNNYFFPEEKYSPRDYVKKNIVNINKIKFAPNFIIPSISPFLLYLPTKEFFKPTIYDLEENDFESNIMKKTLNYFICFLKWDKNTETICFSQLLYNFEPNFNGKGIKKFKYCLDENIYDIIKKRKYQKLSIIPMKWEMSFDYLLEEAYIES